MSCVMVVKTESIVIKRCWRNKPLVCTPSALSRSGTDRRCFSFLARLTLLDWNHACLAVDPGVSTHGFNVVSTSSICLVGPSRAKGYSRRAKILCRLKEIFENLTTRILTAI
jgi:hypothetical protein